MVTYNCEICERKYNSLKEAQDCEAKGIVGPYIKPGLLLSHKTVEEGFLIIDNGDSSQGHSRRYFVEEVTSLIDKDHLTKVQSGFINWNSGDPTFISFLKSYRQATDEEVKEIGGKLTEGKIHFSRLENSLVLHNDTPKDLFSQ